MMIMIMMMMIMMMMMIIKFNDDGDDVDDEKDNVGLGMKCQTLLRHKVVKPVSEIQVITWTDNCILISLDITILPHQATARVHLD